ncbi:MAG: hypothetical protein SCAL_000181 [Candidatus Syntrophoarchaeum caldarius]|uniref:Uncharacterized protein n=1 Tax=Candidatus Syntropharchaeum caldarium TaxID=1838285 RepID=A0A1F2PBT7_9EURY|nr:MAG: hypothetical protein SCAL_000181 [Candidatus Syntrophoarchaeum caldarius]
MMSIDREENTCSSSVSLVVMNEPVEDENPEILETMDHLLVTGRNLVYLHLNSSKKCHVFLFDLYHRSFEFVGDADLHNSLHHLSNSSRLMGFLLPDSSSFNTSSVDLTTSLARESLTSFSSSGISDISAIFLPISSSSISCNLSEIAFNATAGQSTQSILDIRSFSLSGITTFIFAIPIAYGYIGHSFINSFSQMENSTFTVKQRRKI